VRRRPFLHSIEGTKPPDTPQERVRRRVRSLPKPPALLQCPRCGGRELIEARIGMYLKRSKPTGGTKALLCACCLLKGKRIVVS
jgi:hypothetical protein